MRQEAEKTIVAKIRTDELTQIKKEALDDEFSEFQAYIRGDDADLYSATKQAADAHIDTDNLRDDHEYPWFIRNDVFDVEQHDTEVADWWMNIPVSQVYGGVNVPINPHESIPDDAELKDSKIVNEDGEYYAHLSIKQRVELQDEYDGVLAVDLGSRWVAVSVALPSRETMFYGNCADIIRNFALDSKRRERTIRSCPSRIASGVRLTTDSTRLADRLLKTLRSGIFSSSLVTLKTSRIRRWGLK